MNAHFIRALVLFGTVGVVTQAWSRDIRVPADHATVQAAIDAALPGDSIVIADGVYAGPGNAPIRLRGKLLEVRSENGPAACELNGGGSTSVIIVDEPQPDGTAIRGIAIRNGFASLGGGAYVGFGAILFEDCIIEDNLADEGGGAYVARDELAVVRFRGCTVRRNTADRYGGGVRGDSPSLFLERCLITDNAAVGAEWNHGVGGGGFFTTQFGAEPGVIVVDCEIDRNRARSGGGIAIGKYGLHHIRRSRISGNVAEYIGGGVLAGERIERPGSTPFLMEDCQITGNHAEWSGGGADIVASAVGASIRRTTIAFNSSNWYGGGVLLSSVTYGVQNAIEVDSAIVTSNEAAFGSDLALDNGGVAVMSYSLLYGDSPLWVSSDSFVVWITPNINADPLFLDPDGPDNDPNTYGDNDFSLSMGSPCIEAGHPGVGPSLDFLDARRHVRPWDGDGDGIARVDVGAYEYGSSCPGDLDSDGAIALGDLSILLSRFGQPAIPNHGDIDGDGQVTLDDLAFILADFGSECPS